AHAAQSIHEAVAGPCVLVVVIQNVRHRVCRRRSYLPPDGHGAMLRIIKQLAVVVAQKIQTVPVRARKRDVDLAALHLDGGGWSLAYRGSCAGMNGEVAYRGRVAVVPRTDFELS